MERAAEDKEALLDTLVRRFYDKGLSDQMLGPVFRGAIHDFESHFGIVAAFWSHALYGTTRYRGRPFPTHMHMPIEPEHFDRWLVLFRETAEETLSPMDAQTAIGRAEHMTKSFKAGLFPFIHPDGKISRHPYKGGSK